MLTKHYDDNSYREDCEEVRIPLLNEYNESVEEKTDVRLNEEADAGVSVNLNKVDVEEEADAKEIDVDVKFIVVDSEEE